MDSEVRLATHQNAPLIQFKWQHPPHSDVHVMFNDRTAYVPRRSSHGGSCVRGGAFFRTHLVSEHRGELPDDSPEAGAGSEDDAMVDVEAHAGGRVWRWGVKANGLVWIGVTSFPSNSGASIWTRGSNRYTAVDSDCVVWVVMDAAENTVSIYAAAEPGEVGDVSFEGWRRSYKLQQSVALDENTTYYPSVGLTHGTGATIVRKWHAEWSVSVSGFRSLSVDVQEVLRVVVSIHCVGECDLALLPPELLYEILKQVVAFEQHSVISNDLVPRKAAMQRYAESSPDQRKNMFQEDDDMEAVCPPPTREVRADTVDLLSSPARSRSDSDPCDSTMDGVAMDEVDQMSIDDKVAILKEMGFESNDAVAALESSGGDVELAVASFFDS